MTIAAQAPPPETSPRLMTDRGWLAATLGWLCVGIALNLLLAWRTDIFGLLRDTRGRQIATSRHERQAKYLLNYNYVPNNFDALVTGASATVNWDMRCFTGYRFYDDSIEGGNGTEVRMIVEKALEKGHFKVALVGLGDTITSSHALRDGLDEVSPHEALGSVYSYIMMLDALRERLTHSDRFRPDGSHEIPHHQPEPIDPTLPHLVKPQDPKALEDYRTMIEELQARGTIVIYVFSPQYAMDLDGSKEQQREILENFLNELPPAPLIDFSAEQYAALRNNPDNFTDTSHLSAPGSVIFSKIANERMHEILHDR